MIPVEPISAVAGGVMAVAGAAQQIIANNRLKRLASKRQARETPKELIESNQLALNQAQSGLGASSLDYFTKQNDRSFSASLDAVTRMGGDPNSVSSIFDRQMQGIMKVANDDALMKYQKTSRVFDSLSTLAQERLANWADREATLKDKMASEAMKVKAGSETMKSGLNLGLSSITAMNAGKGYDTGSLSKSSSVAAREGAVAIQRQVAQPLSTTILPRTTPNFNVNNNSNNFIGPIDWWNG